MLRQSFAGREPKAVGQAYTLTIKHRRRPMAANPQHGRSRSGPGSGEGHDPREGVISAQKARSGIELHRMRYVLGFGLAGVIVAFILAWYFMFRV
jgi:hypothetical protein